MKRLGILSRGVVVLAGGLLLWNDRRVLGDGPVSAGSGGSETGQTLGVGVEYSIGHTLLANTGKRPAVVVRVRLLGVSGGLELLGVMPHLVPDGKGQGMFLGLFGATTKARSEMAPALVLPVTIELVNEQIVTEQFR
ncbi:MAG: hypothetical protein ACRDV9_03400 [Acidimicrobiia bacterium]